MSKIYKYNSLRSAQNALSYQLAYTYAYTWNTDDIILYNDPNNNSYWYIKIWNKAAYNAYGFTADDRDYQPTIKYTSDVSFNDYYNNLKAGNIRYDGQKINVNNISDTLDTMSKTHVQKPINNFKYKLLEESQVAKNLGTGSSYWII